MSLGNNSSPNLNSLSSSNFVPKDNDLKDIGIFLVKRLSPIIFNFAGLQGTGVISTDSVMTIKFEPYLPPLYQSLWVKNDSVFSDEQKYFIQALSFFFGGVYEGAMLHFGYSCIYKNINIGLNSIAFIFEISKLSQPYEAPMNYA